MKKILAIDYGQKNIGLAIADTPFPEPLPGLKVQDPIKDLDKIVASISSYSPELIIVGMPEGELAEEISDFVTALQAKFGNQVLTHPETLSTREALSKLRESGAKRKKIQNEHSYSAALILEDYLVTCQK